tara:strand:+ start:389 stop:1174 length:786 start_codon:yes stop_codon:yes gene_type:complete
MADTTKKTIIITKECVQRIARDVKDIMKDPLDSHGIYYVHNEDNLLEGAAFIIGPENTPYEGGYYFFGFTFPQNYPHAPPHVTFLTNDGVTRMNPNLYRSGKVCLSILNTWIGPKWSGCQTIRSVLLSICTLVFVENPLLNEPGISLVHRDMKKYNEIISYKNYEVAVIRSLKISHDTSNSKKLYEKLAVIMKQHFMKNYNQYITNLNKLHEKYKCSDKMVLQTTMYGIKCYIDYEPLKAELKSVYNNFMNSKIEINKSIL